jgi:S-adenosylmethionine synthetase
MARHLALHTLHSNPQAERVKVQLAYAIGVAEPVSYRVFDPLTHAEYSLGSFTPQDLTPQSIIDTLKLQAPIYAVTARDGHFGRSYYSEAGREFYTWERG